jgi:hypothetical protein
MGESSLTSGIGAHFPPAGLAGALAALSGCHEFALAWSFRAGWKQVPKLRIGSKNPRHAFSGTSQNERGDNHRHSVGRGLEIRQNRGVNLRNGHLLAALPARVPKYYHPPEFNPPSPTHSAVIPLVSTPLNAMRAKLPCCIFAGPMFSQR